MKIRLGDLRRIIRGFVKDKGINENSQQPRRMLMEFPEGVCAKCGNVKSKGKKFCGNCGSKMGFCPNPDCGSPLNDKPTQKFCGKCGEKLVASPGGATSTASAGSEKSPPSPPLQKTSVEVGSKKTDIADAVEKKVTQKLGDKFGLNKKDVKSMMSSGESSKQKRAILSSELKMVQSIYDKWTSKSVIADLKDFSIRREQDFLEAMKTAVKDDSAPNVIMSNVNDTSGRPLSSEEGWGVFLVGGKPTFICIPKELWKKKFG